MSPILLVIILVIGWFGLVGLFHAFIRPWLAHAPGGDALSGLLWRGIRIYARVIHRLRVIGRHLIPPGEGHGGLIVISNHTGAADPLLIQTPCRFLIRWLMAREYMLPTLQRAWDRYGLIPVDRDGSDSGPLRTAIRHVRSGGAIGIFPEGRIASIPGEIWPFFAGVDLIVAKTRAPILLVWVHGTPEVTNAMHALTTTSHARVEFLDLVPHDAIPDGVAPSVYLRERLAQASGWELNDTPPDLASPHH